MWHNAISSDENVDGFVYILFKKNCIVDYRFCDLYT